LAFLVVPIYKYSKQTHRTKRSLPKWILPNPALVDQKIDRCGKQRGFLIENLVGGHLLNLSYGFPRAELKYWRENNQEIDYILTDGEEPLFALEVKSGRKTAVADQGLLAAKAGIPGVPFFTVTSNTLATFLTTTSIREILAGRWSN
jgi:predicted AAA+ superfamily ATPase